MTFIKFENWTGGFYIDDEDFDKVSKYNWWPNLVALEVTEISSRINGSCIYLSRYLMGVSDTTVTVDHKDRNPLNNQKNNLRVCTSQQNAFNKAADLRNTSGYKGVGWHKQSGKWQARIRIGTFCCSKLFLSKEAAALWYNEKAKILFKDFAYLNEIPKENRDALNTEKVAL